MSELELDHPTSVNLEATYFCILRAAQQLGAAGVHATGAMAPRSRDIDATCTPRLTFSICSRLAIDWGPELPLGLFCDVLAAG